MTPWSIAWGQLRRSYMDDFGKALYKQLIDEQYLDKEYFDQHFDERFDVNLEMAKASEDMKKSA